MARRTLLKPHDRQALFDIPTDEDLHHDRRTPTAGAKFAGEPGRCCITFPDHLVPSSGGDAGLQARIDPERTQEHNTLRQTDQIPRSRCIGSGTQPMEARLTYCRINVQQSIKSFEFFQVDIRD